MPPQIPSTAGYPAEPHWSDRLKMGVLMGGAVGASAGCVMGMISTLVYGPGPNGYLRTIGTHMLTMGGMFGGIMGVGALIRSDASEKQRNAFYVLRQRDVEAFRQLVPPSQTHRSWRQ